MAQVRMSYKVQNAQDTVVSLNGDVTYAGQTVQAVCDTPGSGYSLEAADGLHMSFTGDSSLSFGASFDDSTGSAPYSGSISALPHYVGVDANVNNGIYSLPQG